MLGNYSDSIEISRARSSFLLEESERIEQFFEEDREKGLLQLAIITKEIREKVPFFNKVHSYINKKWNEINTHNCVYTDIYRRKLLFNNYEDLNRNKLFNKIT